MSKFIKVGKTLVPVSDEIYKQYFKMKRCQRYQEQDIKLGSSSCDMATGKVIYKPSKEDSIERLMAKGRDFADELYIEDIIIDREIGLILQKAIQTLSDNEKELVDDLFYKKMSIREVARKEGISHVSIIKRRDKILVKLKKFFSNFGYH